MGQSKLKIMLVILGCLFMFNTIQAQIDSLKYWVVFNDKMDNGYAIDEPEEFLTPRAIQRRINQNIPIDEKDLPVTQNYINQVDGFPGVSILYPSKWFNAVAILTVDTTVVDDILLLPFVSLVKSVKGFKGEEIVVETSDKEMNLMPNKFLDIDYGLSYNQVQMLNGVLLHAEGYEGQGMRIGVIDAGFRLVDQLEAFEHLFDDNRIIATKDFVSGDDNVYEENTSTHGMFVLSTMGGILPDSAYGTATQAEYILLRSENTASELRIEEYNWVAAAEFADSLGADIITTSLGYTTFDIESMDYTYDDLDGDTGVLTQAADIAASRGMLIVNSAGNSGANDWHYIGIAADGDSVLAIGAVNPEGIHASFSSFGPTSDGRVKPNVMAQGRQSVVCDFDNTPRTANGTSFSGPILAGMAACLWQMHPELNNMQIFHAIEQSAHLYETPNDSMGFGIPDFWEAHMILDAIIGIEEIPSSDNPLNIFPNPAINSIRVEVSSDEPLNSIIDIFDANGSLVLSKTILIHKETHFIDVDISTLPNGTYIMRISNVQGVRKSGFVVG